MAMDVNPIPPLNDRTNEIRILTAEIVYPGAPTLRLADGTDAVPQILIANDILKQYRGGESLDFGN